MSALSIAIEGAAKIVRPPPDRTAWQWADAVRKLPPESAEPGDWKTSRVPYCFEPYEAASDPACQTLVLVMGTQMGKTEFELNVLGHRFDDGPYCPALYVGPTQKQVSSMSRDRFQKMIKQTAGLYDKLARGQDDKITEKSIGGVRLGFAWAGSPTELSSHPCGLAVVDERDRMDDDVAGEGDPVELVRARLATYPNRLLVVVSTPTAHGASPIVHLFNDGTKRMWYWPCKHCDQIFQPTLELLHWPDTDDHSELQEATRIGCPECGCEHENRDKQELNGTGKYIAHKISDDGEYIRVDAALPNSTFSYWINGLCSPWVTWGERAVQYQNAINSNNQKRLQAVVNTAFGQTFKIKGEAPALDEMRELIVDIPRGTVPDSAQLITMGCDVQKNGIYYVVRAWSFNDVSHLVDNGFLFGPTEYDDVWILWSQLLQKQYTYDQKIRRCFIDSGYNPRRERFRRPTHKVYEATRRTSGLAFPSKGLATSPDDRHLTTSKQDVNRRGVLTGSVLLWKIGTDHYKSWLRSHTNLPEGQAVKFTLHEDTEEDYLKQMIAEELMINDNGSREWNAGGRDNHYFDCEVLAKAAADSLIVHALPAVNPARQAPKPTKPREHADPRMNHRGGGFRRR